MSIVTIVLAVCACVILVVLLWPQVSPAVVHEEFHPFSVENDFVFAMTDELRGTDKPQAPAQPQDTYGVPVGNNNGRTRGGEVGTGTRGEVGARGGAIGGAAMYSATVNLHCTLPQTKARAVRARVKGFYRQKAFEVLTQGDMQAKNRVLSATFAMKLGATASGQADHSVEIRSVEVFLPSSAGDKDPALLIEAVTVTPANGDGSYQGVMTPFALFRSQHIAPNCFLDTECGLRRKHLLSKRVWSDVGVCLSLIHI